MQIGAGKTEGKSALKGGLKVSAHKKDLKKQSSGVQFGDGSFVENAPASPSGSPLQLNLEKSSSLIVNKAPIVTKKSSIRPSMRLTEQDDQKAIAKPKKGVVWNEGETPEAEKEPPMKLSARDKGVTPLPGIKPVEAPTEAGAETHRGSKPS